MTLVCPACGQELTKIEADTITGKAEFYACPSGLHFFRKVLVPIPAPKLELATR